MNTNADTEPQTVFIVDDDDESRAGMEALMESVDLPTRGFRSAAEFLDTYILGQPGCLLLDVRMPGMGGMELHDKLNRQHVWIPVILITAYAEVELAVTAMKNGAYDFMEKPFSPQELLDKVRAALAHDQAQRLSQSERSEMLRRQENLSDREREILDHMMMGKNAKEMAIDLGISERTVDFHRRNILDKFELDNVVQVMRKLHGYLEI